mgnify:CR=1 FL=1
MFGDSQALMPAGVKIFNEVGLVYGYLTDNAYIVDFERKVEFLLMTSVLVNENGTFNDEKYESTRSACRLWRRWAACCTIAS